MATAQTEGERLALAINRASSDAMAASPMVNASGQAIGRVLASEPAMQVASGAVGGGVAEAAGMFGVGATQLMDRISRNPVGTSTLSGMQNQGNQSSFDPVIGQWPTGLPMTQSQYDNTKTTSLNLFNQLANIVAVGERPPINMPVRPVARSRSVGYNPPDMPQRALGNDYPNGVRTDANGRITHDIDGNPLNPGAMVAGRSQMDGAGAFHDRGLDPASIERVGKDAGGAEFLEVARGGLPYKTAGTFKKGVNPETGDPQSEIRILSSQSPGNKDIIAGHEVGHAVDWLAKDVKINGISAELKTVYNELNNLQRNGKPVTPETFGYKGDDVSREYMAEAMRAYMQNPNYFKSVAPKTAERIREQVNRNPMLKNVIQFNGVGGLMIGANKLMDGP